MKMLQTDTSMHANTFTHRECDEHRGSHAHAQTHTHTHTHMHTHTPTLTGGCCCW